MPQNQSYRVWLDTPTTDQGKMFMNVLKQEKAHWEFTSTPYTAHLWCIEYGSNRFRDLQILHESLKFNQPRVILLSDKFVSTPNKKWIFFKTPLNARILGAWLQVNFYQMQTPDYEIEETVPPWRTEKIKLRIWPNLSVYPEETAVVMICSMLLHDWYSRDELLKHNIDATLLDSLLQDAAEEDNIIYRSAEQKNLGEKDDGLSLFRRIFRKFSKK